MKLPDEEINGGQPTSQGEGRRSASERWRRGAGRRQEGVGGEEGFVVRGAGGGLVGWCSRIGWRRVGGVQRVGWVVW